MVALMTFLSLDVRSLEGHWQAYLELSPAGDHQIVVIDPSGMKRTLSTPPVITAPDVSPDGRLVAFSGGLGEGTLGLHALHVIGTDGSGLTRLTDGAFAELDPDWSPDADRIVVSQNTSGSILAGNCCRLAIVDAGNGAITPLTGNIGAIQPSWSPDGDTIAYANPAGVWTIPAQGGSPSQLVSGGSHPAFSPDGSRIAYVDGSGTSILSVPVGGGAMTTHLSGTRRIESLSWDRDGIWYVDYQGAGYDGRISPRISRVSLTGSVVTQVNQAGVAEVSSVPGGWTAVSGDFSGDGRDDVATFHPLQRSWVTFRSTGNAFSREVWSGLVSSRSGWTAVPGDFDGDGDDDVAIFHPLNGKWLVLRSDGSSFALQTWSGHVSSKGGWTAVPGDFDGDGDDDIGIFHPLNGSWLVLRSTGSAFLVQTWSPHLSNESGWLALPGDFHEDGEDDIAVFHALDDSWTVLESTGSSFDIDPWSPNVWGD